MTNILQSVVLAELARVAELTPGQTLRVASWLLDHNVRFASSDSNSEHGIPRTLFEQLKASCQGDKRIQAIKDLRQWAIDTFGPHGHNLGTLKGAKDFIDEHFARPIMPGQS